MTPEQVIEKHPELNPDLYADPRQKKFALQRLNQYVKQGTKREDKRAAKNTAKLKLVAQIERYLRLAALDMANLKRQL